MSTLVSASEGANPAGDSSPPLPSSATSQQDLRDPEALSEKPGEAASTDEKPHFPAWQWISTLIGLYLGALLYGLDTTIAADVQTAVYQRFDSIEDLAWVGLGFPMASSAVILLFGRLYGLFNTKWMLNASITVFEVGSALCGAAPNMNALIVGRVIAGIGGCGMYIGALTLLSALGSPKKLVLYNALIGVSWGTGAILGPVVGGAFSVSSATWRWAFYINLPLAALLSPVYIFVTPSYNPRRDLTNKQKLQSIDWLGAFLMAALFPLLLTTVAFSGSTFSWNSSKAIGLWTATGVTLAAVIAQQYFGLPKTSGGRLFPTHFLKSRTLLLLLVATACSATANAVTIYYVPLFFVFTRGDTELDAAVRLLPFIVVFIFFVMLAGATLPLIGRYSLYYLLGSALILSGSALMFTIRHDTSEAKIYGYEVLIACGSGITFQNAYGVAAAKVKPNDKSNAIGFINTAQIGTTALSLAIAGCLYQNLGASFLTSTLDQLQLPGDIARAALGGVGSSVLEALPDPAAAAVIDSVAYTISRIFGMCVAGGALMLCASIAMRHEKVNLSEVAVA